MIDEALHEAHQRIRAHTQGHIPAAVLDPAVPALIRRLTTAANALGAQDPRRVAAAHAVGHLRWSRFQALSPNDPAAQAEMMAAWTVFDQLFAVHPQLVPPELHQLFAAQNPDAEAEGAAQALSQTLGLLQETADRHQFDTYLTMLRGGPAVCPPGHPHHPLAYACLATACRLRSERFGDPDDLAEAVTHARTALAAAPTGHPDRPACHNALGNALVATHRMTGDAAALDEAVTVLRDAVASVPSRHHTEVSLRSNLGAALATRAERGTGVQDLDEAVEHLRFALHRTTDPQMRATVTRNLSGILSERYRRRWDRTDLDEAAALTHDLDEPPPADPPNAAGLHAYLRMTIPDLGERNTSDTAQADRQASLAADLLNRFRDLGERRDADSAVTHARAAADLAGTSDNLLLLTAALQVRFDHYGDLADLDVLLDAGRRTVAATPEGHPQRFAALSHLSVAVRTRYEHTGVDRDLDEAVDLSRAAVDAASEPGHRAKCRSNLGLALRMRAAVTGDVDDLDEAVAAFEAALDDLHADHHDRGLVLQNLAGTLRNRAASARQPEDLDAAIGHLGEALSTTPETSLRWGSYAAKLSSALRHRYRDQREPADLELAVALARRAADAPDATESVALERIASLGRALLTRGEADRSVTDLDEAIDQLRQAARISDGSYNQAVVHTELGIALWARHALAGNPHDAAEGDTILRGVVESDLPVSVRLHAAEEWGTAALGQPDGARSALDAYTHAVRLLPLSAWRGIDERSRERVLSNSRIAGGAAGAAIAAGHPHQALELLEQSRAVGWSQQLELRSDLTALAAAAPATAGRLAAARTAMHAQDRRMAPAGRKQRIAASREWDAAVAEARTVPGFAGFLRPAAASDLYRAAAAGPVIIVGITEPRCVALVVTTDDVIPVPLPMDKAQLEAHSLAFLAASQVLGSADLDLDLIVAREEVLTETLSWLWDTVARPVLDALGIGPAADGDTVWPRVWWCPIGTMSLMPLHAAGHHARCDGSTVLDRVVSSYTPTLNTLIAVRERIGPVPDAGEPFLVIAPDDAVGPHLPAAAEERQLLRELLGADHCRLLTGADATVEAVREALGQHRLFHLNGHGWQDLFNPSTARIDLADGGITLTELAGAERADGDFAFLSACHTMTGGMNVPDEVMTLASAVQFAGFRHVLGTLWAVPDASAGALSAAFYRHLADGGRLRTDRSAVALHRSVRGLREDAEELPSLWAPFIHAGP